MNSIKLKYIFFLFLIAIAGCRKDEKTDRQIIVEPSGNPTIEVTSGVTGLVLDEEGLPVVSAAVMVYNKQTKTDENGVFYVNNVGLNRENSHVQVVKSGYFDGFKSFIPSLGSKSFIQLQLVNKGSPAVISSAAGGTVDVSGGAQVTLPPNSIVYKDGGDQYSGDIHVFSHWYDPTDPDLGSRMPGNLLGLTSEDTEVQLGTFGMIAVELETPQGRPLQLSDDAKATLMFPVSEELSPDEVVDLWSFDEIDHVWIQEGKAELEGSNYIAQVSHFSFWNCDAPFPLIKLTGRVMYNGNPVTNLPVSITLDNLSTAYGHTDNDGYFRGKVPKDELLTLKIRHCNETLATKEIGPFDSDSDVGTIDVELLEFSTIIQGTLVGCLDEPLPNAYGLLKSNGFAKQIITPKADGTFISTVAGCSNTSYTIQFFDNENLKTTEVMDISQDIEVNDLMNVRICEGLDQFISYEVDGVAATILTSADVFVSNSNKLIIRGYEPGTFYKFDMDIFANEKGDYNPSTVSIQGDVGPANPELRLLCGDHIANAYTCNQFNITITGFNEYISGTFEGILVAQSDSFNISQLDFDEFAIQGSFRVAIGESVSTGEIGGQFWFDDNGNDTREDDEDRLMETQFVSITRTSGSGPRLFPEQMNAYNKQYKFTNLLPGTYVVRVNKYSGYELVVKDVGSDDRDSDFGEGNNQFETDEITISKDEVFDNVDLGYELPGIVECGNLYFYGCAPEIFVGVNIEGGVPPYKVSLSDGQQMIFNGNPLFVVPTGGVYEMEVEDDVSNFCVSTGSVDDYNNRINGIVWRDIDGGTPFVFDNGDFRQKDITIRLRNEDGSLAGGTQSDNNGNYEIDNIPPGSYYIEIDVPGNLQIVDEKDDSYNGNSINQSNNRSDVFQVDECDFYDRLNVGLKNN